MSEISSKNSDGKGASMTARAEAATLLRRIAGEPSSPVKAAVERAMRRVRRHMPEYFAGNWHYSRAQDLWNHEARRIDAEEMDAIRAAADARAVEGARNELVELNARIARVEAALLLSHPDADRAETDALRSMVRGPGRPVDR